MAYRKKMTRKSSRKNFKRGTKVKKQNFAPTVMRGGIRL